jgi:SAM-dependent methyltransferase
VGQRAGAVEDLVSLRQRLAGLTFYHTIELAPGVSTSGWPAVVPITDMVREEMRSYAWIGKRVLDIGCRDGLLAFEAERLGAAEVVAIDNDFAPGVPQLLTEILGSRVRFQALNLFDLTPAAHGLFDAAIFAGVLYHLRYPMWALQKICDVLRPGATLLIETAILVDDNRHPLLYCPVGGDSPYEPTSCSFFNLRGLTDSVASLGFAPGRHRRLHNLALPSGTALPDKPQIDRCVAHFAKQQRSTDQNVTRYWRGAVDSFAMPPWNQTRT